MFFVIPSLAILLGVLVYGVLISYIASLFLK